MLHSDMERKLTWYIIAIVKPRVTSWHRWWTSSLICAHNKFRHLRPKEAHVNCLSNWSESVNKKGSRTSFSSKGSSRDLKGFRVWYKSKLWVVLCNNILWSPTMQSYVAKRGFLLSLFDLSPKLLNSCASRTQQVCPHSSSLTRKIKADLIVPVSYEYADLPEVNKGS